jgi:DNA-binding protein YbaB
MKSGDEPMSGVSDAGAFLNPDASRDYLRTWREDAERKAERASAMAAQIEQLRTSAKDGNNLAEVTVDSAGVLVDLVLSERIRHFEPQVVARAVMSALRGARTRTAEQAQAIAVEALGPESTSAQVIGERMRQLLERPDSTDDTSGRDQAGQLGHGRPGQGWGR